MVNSYIIDSPQPSNLSYLWNFGSLLALCLIIQIITGLLLAMHYNPSVLEAFNSVEHIMRDVNNGWLLRYLHSNTASAFFFIVYLHIGRGLYYGSYKSPRTLVWIIGTIIFIVMIATAFLGYVLPYGQMSLWGATVITNLMSAIPWVGQDIVEFIWGGFSVNNATLNRFFALHFLLPFVLAALALMHLIALHDSVGSGNPLGVSGNYDRLPFAPYFIFKDLVTIFILIIILSIFVFFMPNLLGDSENYVMANPMQTPPAIVPEWYLLPFYAILRSIPNKLLGVIAMFFAILILLAMPFTDLSKSRGIQFSPLSKITFYIFVGNFLILMQLGARHVESPFIELGQICTILYFSHFLIIIPLISLFESSLVEFKWADLKPNYFATSTVLSDLITHITLVTFSGTVIILSKPVIYCIAALGAYATTSLIIEILDPTIYENLTVLPAEVPSPVELALNQYNSMIGELQNNINSQAEVLRLQITALSFSINGEITEEEFVGVTDFTRAVSTELFNNYDEIIARIENQEELLVSLGNSNHESIEDVYARSNILRTLSNEQTGVFRNSIRYYTHEEMFRFLGSYWTNRNSN